MLKVVELEPVESESVEADARPNPRMGKKAWENAAVFGVAATAGAAGGFLLADPKIEKAVQDIIAKDASKEIDARTQYGWGAVIGGAILAVGGAYIASGKKADIGARGVGGLILGAGAGIAVSGAVQLSAADKLKKARRVLA